MVPRNESRCLFYEVVDYPEQQSQKEMTGQSSHTD